MEREKIASLQHEIWSHWMKYMFSQCYQVGETGDTWIIPPAKVKRWQRQMVTSYSDLSKKEKESDRHHADKILALFRDENPESLPHPTKSAPVVDENEGKSGS